MLKCLPDDSVQKICTCCKQSFPATFDYFHKKNRRGRVELHPRCKECVKAEIYRRRYENPEKTKEILAKSVAKNGAKHNETRRIKIANDPEYREKRYAHTREWAKKNSDYVSLQKMAWNLENPERQKANLQAYYLRTKLKQQAWKRARRARMRGAEGNFLPSDIEKQIKDQDCKCFWCKVDISDGYHIDHYIPLAEGGTNHPYNIVISCQKCNTSRRHKLPIEFFKYLRMIQSNQLVIASMRSNIREKLSTATK
jgi:hypothetical protein